MKLEELKHHLHNIYKLTKEFSDQVKLVAHLAQNSWSDETCTGYGSTFAGRGGNIPVLSYLE